MADCFAVKYFQLICFNECILLLAFSSG
uniref:Uncharacterized protein n=1 Tax=Anguilla anguilla TaxID=7936 RepID=A0A0E9RXG1_ANGAN